MTLVPDVGNRPGDRGERSPQPKRTTITELGLSRSTFYRWQRRYREQGEAGPQAGTRCAVEPVAAPEKTTILETALQQPDLSPRELACHITDHAGFTKRPCIGC